MSDALTAFVRTLKVPLLPRLHSRLFSGIWTPLAADFTQVRHISNAIVLRNAFLRMEKLVGVWYNFFMDSMRCGRTVAVSLCFDEEGAAEIGRCVRRVSDATGNDWLVRNEAPAHLTLGMFHVAEEEIPAFTEQFLAFARDADWGGALEFSGADTFLDRVIFLRLAGDGSESGSSFSRMCALNRRLHALVLSRFESGGNRNYEPERFFPHVALAVKLSPEQCAKGMSFLKCCPGFAARVHARSNAQGGGAPAEQSRRDEPRKTAKCERPDGDSRCAQKKEEAMVLPPGVQIVAVSLAWCHPYREIVRVGLDGAVQFL